MTGHLSTGHLSEDEALAAVPGLTRARLTAFVEAEIVRPVREGTGAAARCCFRRIDIARMQLLCELADDLALDEASLGVVMTLLDQLHTVRRELHAVLRAVEAEPPEVRARIAAALIGPR